MPRELKHRRGRGAGPSVKIYLKKKTIKAESILGPKRIHMRVPREQLGASSASGDMGEGRKGIKL